MEEGSDLISKVYNSESAVHGKSPATISRRVDFSS
jgi:hypothetical protein